uniref:Uncharacterized protein n=1 Tax=Arundo donax TaxID=35708 RepID=A0A0A9E9U5_ARUDO
MLSQTLLLLCRQAHSSSRRCPSQPFNLKAKLLLLLNHRQHCLSFLLQLRHLLLRFKTNLHHNSLAMYHIHRSHQFHLLKRLHQCQPYHRNPIIPHPHSQLRPPTSNTKRHQLRSLRHHSHQRLNITKPCLSMLNILNLRHLQVLTLQLHCHPRCPSSQKTQHLMGLPLRAIHQMSAHHPLICRLQVDLLLLSMDQILACMSLLQSGQSPGHHRHTILDTNRRVAVVSPNLMVTPGPHPTVPMLE